MADILSRDITGHCEGECKDCVRESEADRQKKTPADLNIV
jgi:hypothetical protein